MKIYTIIVTYNAMQWIDRCLASLRNSSIKTDVIVIDNCSADGTSEYIPRNYPEVIWMPQKSNLGFGQGNNVGMRYALEHGADYVLLLNQDASLEKDALSLMLNASDGTNLVTPLMLNGAGTKVDESFKWSIRDVSVDIFVSTIVNGVLPEKCFIGEACAACWFMPINIIKKIGGFNPLFFQYGEDNNFYCRMSFHGIKNIFVPNAIMYHDRILKGNMQIYKNKMLRREMLIIVSDINLSKTKCILKILRLLAICYVRDLPRLNYKPGTFMLYMFWILYHIRSIRNSRKQEKMLGYNWLY